MTKMSKTRKLFMGIEDLRQVARNREDLTFIERRST
jgi:hypothetical protein